MATNFPTSLDTFSNPAANDQTISTTVPHHVQHDNINDAVTALETKVGVNGSTDTNSLDYKLTNLVLLNLTTAQKNAIVSPREGLLIYDTTLHAPCFWNGSSWKTVTAS